MANQAPILQPYLVRQFGNMNVSRPPVSNANNAFPASVFVQLDGSQNLQIVPSSYGQLELIYGWTPDKSHLSTDIPPVTLFGQNHYPFSPLDAEFEINTGTLTSTGTGDLVLGSAASPGLVVLGGKYGISTATTSVTTPYANYQVLDPTITSYPVFEVVGFVDGVASTDWNGRVRVKVIPAQISN
jgi:hypothetical protein